MGGRQMGETKKDNGNVKETTLENCAVSTKL